MSSVFAVLGTVAFVIVKPFQLTYVDRRIPPPVSLIRSDGVVAKDRMDALDPIDVLSNSEVDSYACQSKRSASRHAKALNDDINHLLDCVVGRLV